MFGRKYRWIVLSSCLGSAFCLLAGEARFSTLAAERGWTIGFAWILWAILPGAVGVAVWTLQRRDWLQLAGVVSTVGFLLYSAWFLSIALTTESVNGHSILLPGVVHFVLAFAWSLVALIIGALGGLGSAREPR